MFCLAHGRGLNPFPKGFQHFWFVLCKQKWISIGCCSTITLRMDVLCFLKDYFNVFSKTFWEEFSLRYKLFYQVLVNIWSQLIFVYTHVGWNGQLVHKSTNGMFPCIVAQNFFFLSFQREYSFQKEHFLTDFQNKSWNSTRLVLELKCN